MNTTIKYMILLGVGALLTSCSNYGYISENDVYMQAPTEINLEEDENDITSFNAFKARQKGAYTDEYNDPRLNNTMRFNQFMIINAYAPFGSPYGYGGFVNRAMAFHGMGWNDPYYNSRFYNGFGMSYGIGYGMGNYGMYGNGFYSPYGFHNPYYGGYGYNPYYHGGYYGGYGGYYGGGYYGGNSNTNSGYQQTVYYGQRRSLTSSSQRSSQYVNQKFKSSTSPNSSNGNYDVNDQTLGTSRRAVKKKYASGSEYSNYTNKNGTFTHNGVPVKSGKTTINPQRNNPAHRRAVNKTYTPNSSARRSGVVQQSRRSGVNVRSGARSTPRSNSTRGNVQQTRSVQPGSNSTRSPRMSSPQRSSSPRSTSPSSGSSRRSSGTSSGSSSSSGRR